MSKISRRRFLKSTTSLAAASALGPHTLFAQPKSDSDETDTELGKPTKAQFDWQDLELGTFFHGVEVDRFVTAL